jgi:non-heme chloroperoxidase
MSTSKFSQASFTTSDGVTLRYLSAGSVDAPKILFVPGWSQTAIQWQKQLAYFSAKYRVIALDHRGHGDSDTPTGGYRISRLATDLNEFVTALDMRATVLVCHSMGCSVFWALWSTFVATRARITKLVLVDQVVSIVMNPSWKSGLAAAIGAAMPPAAAYELASGLAGPDGAATGTGLMKSLFSPEVDQSDFEWTMQQVTKMSAKNASDLFVNHATQDWQDVPATITVPTLVVAGEGSFFNYTGVEWIAKQIPGSKVKIFGKNEGGSHFMFWENAEGFNRVVEEFLSPAL